MATHQRRSLARIDRNDLLRLAELAADVEAGLFARHPQGAGRYAGRLVCRALCQGAALHYLDGTNGVKDFDVWSFYAERGDGPFPYRWRGTADYGQSKFGRYPDDPPSFTGRRVDLLGRSLDVPLDAEPAKVLRDYLQRGPALRKNWRQKRSSSSTPSSSPVRSSGLRPVPRDDILICRDGDCPSSDLAVQDRTVGLRTLGG
jgi:hypothetical protein